MVHDVATDDRIGIDLATGLTIPRLVDQALTRWRSPACLHERSGGYWRRVSSEELSAQVRRLALGLKALGLQRGEGVGILCEPSPFWVACDLAAMAAGGVSVPLFPSLAPETLRHECSNGGVRILICGNEALARTALAVTSGLRALVIRGGAVSGAATVKVIGSRFVEELGDQASQADPGRYAALLAAGSADDLATIIHTSGSTGDPKGVALTHRNLLSQILAAHQVFPLDPAHDRALSCLPLAHVMERMVFYTYLTQGAPVWFADDIKQVGALLREVKPTAMTMVPRLIEKLHDRIAAGASASPRLRRALASWAIHLADEHDPAQHDVQSALADRLVYGRLRSALGGKLKYLIVGGAALSPLLTRFLLNLGVPLYIGYGLTETSPVIACNSPRAHRLGTVGTAFPGVQIRIGEHGEIQAKGPGVMKGYHRDAAATAAVFTTDGWFRTGDLGTLDADGFLTITGRMKELLKTSNGKYVRPVPIEQALCTSDLVDHALIVAEGRPCPAALLFPDPERLRAMKTKLGLQHLSDGEFAGRPEVATAISSLIERVNDQLDRWEKIRHHRVIVTPPTIDHQELTPTMKLRRHVLMQHHARLIEQMYAEPIPEGNHHDEVANEGTPRHH